MQQKIALLPEVKKIAREAGEIIARIYREDNFEQATKSDNTPVTSADIAAHQYLTKALSELTPDIPVLSEEDVSIPFSLRKQWQRYWLVDPLDGTQEFIAKSGDFATIIALVENNEPVMGVIYAPIADVSYYAIKGFGAFKETQGEEVAISTMKHEGQEPSSIALAVSRRQKLSAMTDILEPSRNYNMLPLGSACLKSCLVAEGAVDCYIRLGPTGEWDTGGAQCIVEQAGGRILDLNLNRLSYNERESLENPDFIVLGDEGLPWMDLLKV